MENLLKKKICRPTLSSEIKNFATFTLNFGRCWISDSSNVFLKVEIKCSKCAKFQIFLSLTSWPTMMKKLTVLKVDFRYVGFKLKFLVTEAVFWKTVFSDLLFIIIPLIWYKNLINMLLYSVRYNEMKKPQYWQD